MSERNDGGPAFPLASEIIGHCGGMTLRDWFAGQALAGLCAFEPVHDKVAELAYGMADAMLAERAK